MAKTLTDVCLEIANALRTKLGTSSKYKPVDYSKEVLKIGINATATSKDIKAGKTAYVANAYVSGAFTGVSFTAPLSPTEQTYTPSSGQYFNKVIVPPSATPLAEWDGAGITRAKIMTTFSIFTSDGMKTYEFETWMTWGSFIHSDYNIDGAFRAREGYVHYRSRAAEGPVLPYGEQGVDPVEKVDDLIDMHALYEQGL